MDEKGQMELSTHIKEHVSYPISKKDFMASCGNLGHVPGETKAWVEKAERESPQWCLGQTIHPTLAQQYWYETTRAFYEAKNKLSAFLKEYP